MSRSPDLVAIVVTQPPSMWPDGDGDVRRSPVRLIVSAVAIALLTTATTSAMSLVDESRTPSSETVIGFSGAGPSPSASEAVSGKTNLEPRTRR